MDKIVFYKERDFGEKFNVTFEFVEQNWKILLRYALYGILPLAFVGALSLNSLMQNMVDVSSGNSMFSDDLSYSMLFSYALLLPTSLAAYIWIGTVVFSMMQFYNAHDEGLQGVTFQELKPSFRRNAWRFVQMRTGWFSDRHRVLGSLFYRDSFRGSDKFWSDGSHLLLLGSSGSRCFWCTFDIGYTYLYI